MPFLSIRQFKVSRPHTAKSLQRVQNLSCQKKLSIEQQNIINAGKKNNHTYFKRICNK